MRSILLFPLGLLCVMSVSPALAFAAQNRADVTTDISRFSDTIEVPGAAIKVPSVLEYLLPNEYRTGTIYAYDMTTGAFAQAFLREKREHDILVSQILPGGQLVPLDELADSNKGTFRDFPIDGISGRNVVRLRIESPRTLPVHTIRFLFDANSPRPETISIDVDDQNGALAHILNESVFRSDTVSFPTRSTGRWEVELAYRQPIRLSEIVLVGDGVETITRQTVRFLAQPEHQYRLYASKEGVWLSLPQGANLSSDFGVISTGSSLLPLANPSYVEPDTDSDGLVDRADNCPKESNPTQEDVDGNGTGDACDDFDRDGIMNVTDNCPNIPNYRQENVDGDDLGDTCDDYDNRFTERNAWVPWFGIGVAALVLMMLFALVLRARPIEEESSGDDRSV